MQINIVGQHIKLNDDLFRYISKKINTRIKKYYSDYISIKVIFSKCEKHKRFNVTILLDAGQRHKRVLQVQSISKSPFKAFDLAMNKLSTRMRRTLKSSNEHREYLEVANKMKYNV
jgi:ribosomal subunit interface protein